MKNLFVAVPAVLAALVHVYIFALETRITTPNSMKTFGIRDVREAEIMRPWAYNQGWYNLQLALEVFAGVLLLGFSQVVGLTLIAGGVAVMVGAALVLGASDRTKLRAACVQGLFPALAVIALLLRIV